MYKCMDTDDLLGFPDNSSTGGSAGNVRPVPVAGQRGYWQVPVQAHLPTGELALVLGVHYNVSDLFLWQASVAIDK